MTVSERWKIQNKVYRMKARKSELERYIFNTAKHYLYLRAYDPFRKRPRETFLNYFLSVLHLFFVGLDLIVGFYYNKFKVFKKLKTFEKEIQTLTKEIKHYEYKL